MTSCRSISFCVSPATTSLPTVCCQFWTSGSGSRSDSWPRSSSRRWGRITSVQNPRLGDSMLLGKMGSSASLVGNLHSRLSVTLLFNLLLPGPWRRDAHLAIPRCVKVVKRRCATETPNSTTVFTTYLRPILGVKGGVGFSRDLRRKYQL